MKILIALFYILLLVFAVKKLFKKDDMPLDRSDIDFTETKDHISRLNALEDRLEQVENLITDIECCSPDQHQTYITILSGTREVRLHIDGDNQSTQDLLKTLYNERKILRTSLSEEIKNYGVRCNEICNENYKKFERGGAR